DDGEKNCGYGIVAELLFQLIKPAQEHVPSSGAVIDKLRHLVKGAVDLAKKRAPVGENDGNDKIFDSGYGERLHIPAAQGRLIEANEEADKQDGVPDSDDGRYHRGLIDSVEPLIQQLLKIKHGYCDPRCRAWLVLLRKVFTSVELNLSCAPELARSIERTRISSAIADCV